MIPLFVLLLLTLLYYIITSSHQLTRRLPRRFFQFFIAGLLHSFPLRLEEVISDISI